MHYVKVTIPGLTHITTDRKTYRVDVKVNHFDVVSNAKFDLE